MVLIQPFAYKLIQYFLYFRYRHMTFIVLLHKHHIGGSVFLKDIQSPCRG